MMWAKVFTAVKHCRLGHPLRQYWNFNWLCNNVIKLWNLIIWNGISVDFNLQTCARALVFLPRQRKRVLERVLVKVKHTIRSETLCKTICKNVYENFCKTLSKTFSSKRLADTLNMFDFVYIAKYWNFDVSKSLTGKCLGVVQPVLQSLAESLASLRNSLESDPMLDSHQDSCQDSRQDSWGDSLRDSWKDFFSARGAFFYPYHFVFVFSSLSFCV